MTAFVAPLNGSNAFGAPSLPSGRVHDKQIGTNKTEYPAKPGKGQNNFMARGESESTV